MTRFALLACLAVTLASAAAATERYLQAEPRELALEGATRLRAEFPVGSFTLEGDDGATVRVLVRIDCRDHDDEDCHREARRIRIDHHVSGDQLSLKFEGIKKEFGGNPRVNVEARVLAPRSLVARVEMGVGELKVEGMTGDLDLELGVGELSVKAERRHFRSAEAESGVGDATIRAGKTDVRERGFIGHSARWSDGPGSGELRAHVGVGETTITLR